MQKRVAIIGGGIAGLTAAYLLNQKYDIHLYEKDDRLGGNAHTHRTKEGELIDMAVASYHQNVSKTFFKLLSKINVKLVIQPTAASASIHYMDSGEGLYPTPLSLKGLISQKFAMYRRPWLGHWTRSESARKKMLRMLDEGKMKGLSVKDALDDLSPELNDTEKVILLAPLCLLSSMYFSEVMEGPAEYFFGKVKKFGGFRPIPDMLGLHFPKHFTKSYVDALASTFNSKVTLEADIKSVERTEDHVIIKTGNDAPRTFDHVVFACNADQVLDLVEKPTAYEEKLLRPWKFKEGLMVVHKDDTYFPKRELCQSWTCIESRENGTPHLSISCCCWRLCPGTSSKSRYFSTQHPNFPIQEDLIDFQKVFRTPMYDSNSFATLKDLPLLNGKERSYYCGSYFGYGLHNDAVSSAIEVAKSLGVEWN